jgi:microcystin-dependent protein
MSTLFRTGDGEVTDLCIFALEAVDNDWFKRNLIHALELMCDEANWTQDGTATVAFARDKANEMLENVEVCVNIPVIPVGVIQMWILSSTPAKWLRLNGQAVSRITYATLFALYGVTFGAGDGTTTFNLPDMRDLSPYGVGTLIAVAGQVTGTVNETLTTAQLPAHNHDVTDPGHAHLEQITNAAFKGGAAGANSSFQGATTNSAVRATTDSNTTGITTQNAGGNNSHNNVHPVIGVHYIVYAGV